MDVDLKQTFEDLDRARATIQAWNVAEEVTREMCRKGNKFIGAMGVADKLFDRDDWRWNIAVSSSYRLISGWSIITDADGILVEEVA